MASVEENAFKSTRNWEQLASARAMARGKGVENVHVNRHMLERFVIIVQKDFINHRRMGKQFHARPVINRAKVDAKVQDLKVVSRARRVGNLTSNKDASTLTNAYWRKEPAREMNFAKIRRDLFLVWHAILLVMDASRMAQTCAKGVRTIT